MGFVMSQAETDQLFQMVIVILRVDATRTFQMVFVTHQVVDIQLF